MVTVEIDGESVVLESSNYQLPKTVGRVQIDCPVTKGYLARANKDNPWSLDRDARLRLWPKGSPWIRPGTLGYPVDQHAMGGKDCTGRDRQPFHASLPHRIHHLFQNPVTGAQMVMKAERHAVSQAKRLFAMIAAGDTNDPAVMAPMFIAMAILFISMALSMLLIMAAALLLPPATAHAVAHGSFSAAFDFTGWWKILKANFGGFFLAIVIISGVMGIIYFVSYIFYTTIVLMCMMFILPLVFSFYMMLVGYPLYGLAYREGVDKLTAIDDTPVNNGTAAGTRASAEVPSQPVKEAPETPAKAPSKPRAKRPRARE